MVVDTTLTIILIMAAVLVVSGGAFYTLRRRNQGQLKDGSSASIEAPAPRKSPAVATTSWPIAYRKPGRRSAPVCGTRSDRSTRTSTRGLKKHLLPPTWGWPPSTRIVERVRASNPETPDAARAEERASRNA